MAMLNGLKSLISSIVQIKLNILGLCSDQIFKNNAEERLLTGGGNLTFSGLVFHSCLVRS